MKLDEHIDVIAKVGEVAGKEYAIEEVKFSGLISHNTYKVTVRLYDMKLVGLWRSRK